MIAISEDLLVGGEEEGDGAHFSSHGGDGDPFIEGQPVGLIPVDFDGITQKAVGPEAVQEVKDDILGVEAAGAFPREGDLHGGGTLNQTAPRDQTAAISRSPMPWPKQPMAPRMLAWESVDTSVSPGWASPRSMARCVPIPLLRS